MPTGTSNIDAKTTFYLNEQARNHGWKVSSQRAGHLLIERGNVQIETTMQRGQLTAEKRVIESRTRVSDTVVSWLESER